MSRNLVNATKYVMISLCMLCIPSLGLAQGLGTPELRCEVDKIRAAERRGRCLAQEASKEVKDQSFDLAKCEVDFDDAIAKADAKAAKQGAACRYVDKGLTVFDLDTLLEWQKSTDDGDATLDKDNTYKWTVVVGASIPDGDLFTDFLGDLNFCGTIPFNNPVLVNPGYANHCDWRIPHRDELLSIVDCSFGSPCIDPIFGPTTAAPYWTSFNVSLFPSDAITVRFTNGTLGNIGKSASRRVRAVRGSGRN